MSERGVFAVDRGVWDHPIFANEPFTEREAWLWMVSAAAWVAKRVRVGRATIELRRGQLAFATRFMAERWQWAHSRVVRFIKRLEIDTMVSTLATREATLITICNYDKYAFGRNTNETQTETQTETLPERPRNKEEELKKDNNQELKTDQRKRAARLPSDAVPSDRNRSDAIALGLNPREIEDQWARMRNWSASAKNGACLDWDARWRNWCSTFMDGRKPSTGPPGRPLTEFQRRRNETVEILNELDSYVTRSGSGEENSGILSGDPSQRPQGLHSGIGSTVIDLPALGYRTRN